MTRGGVDTRGDIRGNGVARHAERFEPFRDYAFAELEAAPLHQAGVCFLPQCGRRFDPSVSWQMYCCKACERAGLTEFRKWGLRAAPALLAWRLGKYASDGPVADRTRSARRFVTAVQSAWIVDRADRAKDNQTKQGAENGRN
ncbi:MAG: hypothetical protein HWE26_13770 [Alteromonadaceae bacterium]|nr:hypothetical protein [Alteromonadaceae bacterium]